MSEHNPKLPSRKALAELDTLDADIEREARERQKLQHERRAALVEKARIHPEAFALMRKLKAMEPTARNAYLEHFLHYCQVFDLDKQLDLFEVPVAEQIEAMSQAGARVGLGQSGT